MTTQPAPAAFTLEAFHNPYLAIGATRVDAIVSVTASGVDIPAAGGPRLLLGFIIDTSGSMQGARLTAAAHAVEAAVQLLDEAAMFFVVGFANFARVVVPTTTATPKAKANAAAALRGLAAAGGTAMAQGLAAARSLVGNHPDSIAQCLFLTDGKDESERPEDLANELGRSAAIFACDCWGVGTDWQVGEVQRIASALLGKATLIPDAAGIESAFREAVGKAQAKSVKDVRLRVWTPAAAQLLAVKQVSPTIEDLTDRAADVSAQVRDYPTGAWAPREVRDYQVAVRVTPGRVGDEMLAARPSVVYREPAGSEAEVKSPDARVLARWTGDEALSSRLDPAVAHYGSQDDLASAIRDGLQARSRGDDGVATELLGRAVRLAAESANGEMTSRLARVVDVVDQGTGTVRLRKGVSKAAEMDLELESTTTQPRTEPPR